MSSVTTFRCSSSSPSDQAHGVDELTTNGVVGAVETPPAVVEMVVEFPDGVVVAVFVFVLLPQPMSTVDATRAVAATASRSIRMCGFPFVNPPSYQRFPLRVATKPELSSACSEARRPPSRDAGARWSDSCAGQR